MHGADGDEHGESLTECYTHGQFVVVTEPDCPGCILIKDEPAIAAALADGTLLEVGPDHPDHETILAQCETWELPVIAEFDARAGRFVDTTAPG